MPSASTAPPPIVVACAEGSAILGRIESELAQAGSFAVTTVLVPDSPALDDALSRRPLACIAFAGMDAQRAIARACVRAEPPIPVIALGASPADPAGVRCWFPDLPSAATLQHVLHGLSSERSGRESSVRWRRKADVVIGRSPPIQALLGTLDRLASSSATVLVTGESGTGKELVARALHYGGPRASRGIFVAINCAAVPETLFEAELFGHERGAFTGATGSRPGLFEAAHRGTLLLDEMGDLPPSLQAKLLRVIETRTVMRLGSTTPRTIDVRIVAATARDLESAMRAGEFRQDLYYRLSVHQVHVAPLRERLEDIPALVAHHLGEICRREGRAVPPVTAAALQKLSSYSWPGNVRELLNVIERALLSAGSKGIDGKDVQLPVDREPTIHSYGDAKRQFDLTYYTRLMRIAGGNVSLAARMANKTRKEVYQALRRLGLDRTGARRSSLAPPPLTARGR